MNQWQLEYRNKVLFAGSKDAFSEMSDAFLRDAAAFYERGAQKKAILYLKDMCLDLGSFLTHWKLDRWLPKEEKEKFIDRCMRLLKSWSPEEAADAERQISEQKDSQMARISEETLRGNLNVYWGHDKCDDIDFDLRHGASFTTSNPGKINGFRTAHPEEWEAMTRDLVARKELSAQEIFHVASARVVCMMARHMRPVFDATNGQFGASSIQVDPTNMFDSRKMADEIVDWYRYFQEELDMEVPNVTFKVPATKEAAAAAREVAAQFANIKLCATSNFSTRQHLEFMAGLDHRNPATWLVIVDVHLRSSARPELEALGLEDVEGYCEKLVTEIYRVCYRNLLAAGSNIQINGAGIRDWQGVRNNLTANARLPVTLTIMPGVVEDANRAARCLDDVLSGKTSEEDMAVLNQCKTFRQAYYPEEFPWDDIYSFKPFAMMMDGFLDHYHKCLASIEERRSR